MGRRWGKSTLGGVISLGLAAHGGRVAWCVPQYRNGRPLWRFARSAVAQLVADKIVRANESDRLIEFPNGGSLGVYSMDNPDAIRGDSFHLAILDEAAMMPETVWSEAIEPTLADYGGEAFLISTPKGRNWFWREWQNGRDGTEDYASWTAPSRDNPNPNIQRAAELARIRLPERSYRQEWLAEFLEDGGGVFRGVRRAAVLPLDQVPILGHEYIFGVDWGRFNDFTVITIIDATVRQVVGQDSFTGIGFALQRGRLKIHYQKWRPHVIVAEANSIGLPNIEALQSDGLPVTAFTTTNASKQLAIDGLSLSFEEQTIQIVNDPELIAELEAYEMERLPSGLQRFSAPEGMHDDRVMSLAIGWSALGDSGPLLIWDDDAVG